MESTPGDPNNSETNLYAKADEESCRRIGGRAVRRTYDPTYEPHEDAHSALGGGIKSYRTPAVEKVYPTGLSETILFADRQQRESVDPRHAEFVRVYELSLDVLASSQFHQLSLKDQMRVAVAGHEVIAATEHRASVLRVDGNFEHPAFQHYGFASQQEADAYAVELKTLQHDLMTREVVMDIELMYRALASKSRRSTMSALAKQTRDLLVIIEEDGKVKVGSGNEMVWN